MVLHMLPIFEYAFPLVPDHSCSALFDRENDIMIVHNEGSIYGRRVDILECAGRQFSLLEGAVAHMPGSFSKPRPMVYLVVFHSAGLIFSARRLSVS